jgi:hypothetical protein
MASAEMTALVTVKPFSHEKVAQPSLSLVRCSPTLAHLLSSKKLFALTVNK